MNDHSAADLTFGPCNDPGCPTGLSAAGGTVHPVTKQVQTFDGFDRPDIEVLVDGTWWPGELRMWTQRDDDSWHGNVVYRDHDGQRSITVPTERIRQDTVDRSGGRGV